jgi:hypothetical protein
MLTDERLDELWLSPMSFDWEHREYARLVESEVSAPLLARIAELESCLGTIKYLLSRDPCIHANTAIQMIDTAMKEQP